MTSRAIATMLGAAAVALSLARPATGAAQPAPTVADTLRLGALQEDAVRRDPRGRQLELLELQSGLRLRSLDAERMPSIVINAQGQYQSDVATLPFQLPGGDAAASPPLDTYDAHVALRQSLYDPARGPRRDVERARLAESQARVRTTIFALRQRVAESYFAALMLEAQQAELATVITDLDAQLGMTRDRVRLGSALPSEAATLEAELLRRRQSNDQLGADRDAALVVLGELAGRTITASDALALPDLAADVATARAARGELRARPEYAQFARSREALGLQKESVAAQDRPRVSAFGRAGYGRPGLNPLARDFDEYWLAGIQVEWTPWSWGTTARRSEELAIQQQIVDSEEAAFAESLVRSVAADLTTVDRLAEALRTDDRIVELRESILGETRARLAEGVITSAEYVDRQTDVLAARLARATHRVELAQARARFLTLVGLEAR